MIELRPMRSDEIPIAVRMDRTDISLSDDESKIESLTKLAKVWSEFQDSLTSMNSAYFQRFIDDSDKFAYSIIADGKMVGYIVALTMPHIEFESNIYIDSIRIADDEQKKGYGTTAMELFFSLFPDSQTFTLVTKDSIPAYHMYQKLGFTDNHTTRMTRSILSRKIQQLEEKLQLEIRKKASHASDKD